MVLRKSQQPPSLITNERSLLTCIWNSLYHSNEIKQTKNQAKNGISLLRFIVGNSSNKNKIRLQKGVHISQYWRLCVHKFAKKKMKVLYLLTTTRRNAFVGPGISRSSLNLPFVRMYCILVLAALTVWISELFPPPTKCVPLSVCTPEKINARFKPPRT